MAEFAEVMKQAKRMCGAYDRCANGCPLRGKPCFIDLALNDMPKVFERTVMDWAAEHPEPKYPTWGEWFVGRGDLIEGYDNATNPSFLVERMSGVLRSPIPADIAEKLGIEPIKEGKE